jgi:hypothetical protein
MKFFKFLFVAFLTLSIIGCNKFSYDVDQYNKEKINENVQKVFGTTFDPSHDWCTAINGTASIDVPAGVKCVQLLSYVKNDDGETSLLVLNEKTISNESSITLSYDVQSDNLGIYVAYISDNNYVIKDITKSVTRSLTRSASASYTLPGDVLKITSTDISYANQRGWIPGETLYQYNTQKMSVADYDDEYKAIFRSLIFSYFKNGRKYNNLPLVKNSGFYNESYYPFTTGSDPIIVSPVYKNDGGYKEVENSDLYYYYFKDSEITGDPVKYLESLPKYKVIQFNECIKGDDVICKHASYALVYWGEGIPDENTVGSYQFPEGYKIGFMVRAKTTAEGGKKQGELYGDGRLNNYINSYSKCNFKSSNLGTDGPRAGWMTVNGKMILCFESGTDADFNDIILEIEGGVEPIIVIPELESNYYTFCFEDTQLGDYDLNDVVIKARRINETTVEYSVVACGAMDKLKIMNINGKVINGNTEVHQMFGTETGFINTTSFNHEPVVDQINVDKNFSFLDDTKQPYIVDITTNNVVKLAKIGEDPHAIMIPYDFKYPIEKVCVKDAYLRFNEWGKNKITSTDWYIYPETEKVIKW